MWISKILKISRFLIIFLLITGWVFSGWPRIWKTPRIPQEIQKTLAVETYYATSTTGTWTVPAGVGEIIIYAWGGGGGGGGDDNGNLSGGDGGGGGFASTTVTVSAGTTIAVKVGGGGVGGVGTGSTDAGGGGGGYSSASTTATNYIVAGGGGGGGAGSDTNDESGGDGGAGGGSSGQAGGNGADDCTGSTVCYGFGGGGGTSSVGGSGGDGATGTGCIGTDGGAWKGGAGGGNQASCGTTGAGAAGTPGGAIGGGSLHGGGGGGGGYYGGGGAEAGRAEGGGGGGGGSSYIAGTGDIVQGNYITPGNSADSIRSTYCSNAGAGGAGGVDGGRPGTTGERGCVVIAYNRIPSFAGGAVPTESSDPVDYGSTVTFSATAGDADADPWYLAICDSGGVTAQSGAAPTCNSTTYCVSSSAVASSSPNTCDWSATTVGIINWQGYAADATTTPNLATTSPADITNSPLRVKGTLTLAEEGGGTPGQITDQFAGDAATTTELFRFRLTPNYENASTTLTLDLSSVTGIASGDITSGNIYVDSDTNGRISADETTTAFGCGSPSISAGSGTIACNATTTLTVSTNYDYIYKATVSNLTANDTITFGLSTAKIVAFGLSSLTYTSRLTVSGSASNVAHTADESGYLYFSIDGDISFPSVTPGTLVATTSILTARTNNSTGFYITVERNDTDTTMDLSSDASVNISDKTAWDSGGACGNATASTTEPQTLQFRVRLSGTDSANYYNCGGNYWWGINDTTASAKFAGFPLPSASNKTIINRSSSATATTTAIVLYNLNVSSTQQNGVYNGGITYTITTNP